MALKWHFMELRRVLKFNTSLGLTLPVSLSKALGIHWKDYVEVFFIDPDKILIKKHKAAEGEKIENV